MYDRSIYDRLERELNEAETKAWDALSRYKFQMFGYWAAIWVHLNRIGEFGRPNPWKSLVLTARACRFAAGEAPPEKCDHEWYTLMVSPGDVESRKFCSKCGAGYPGKEVPTDANP